MNFWSKMAYFHGKIKGSLAIRNLLPGSLVLFYLLFQTTALYCRCIEGSSHQHINPAAQEFSAKTQGNQDTHDHRNCHGMDSAGHPTEKGSNSHFPCYCSKDERLTLASSASTLPIPSIDGKVLPSNLVHQIELLLANPQSLLLSNRSPPALAVSSYLKNHAFLI
ncbi:MAG TPA: hypothetical protein VJR29_11370 [bacterium]|nr:hypothetical protein [bacterium]